MSENKNNNSSTNNSNNGKFGDIKKFKPNLDVDKLISSVNSVEDVLKALAIVGIGVGAAIAMAGISRTLSGNIQLDENKPSDTTKPKGNDTKEDPPVK